jgi:inner membrane protein
MDKKLLLKLVAIGFMSLLLLVPLALIEDQIRQRSSRQDEVQRGIANSSAGPQTLTGPVLAIHYRENSSRKSRRTPPPVDSGASRALPSSLYLPAETPAPDRRGPRGNPPAGHLPGRLYHLDLAVAGRFVLPVHLGLDSKRTSSAPRRRCCSAFPIRAASTTIRW